MVGRQINLFLGKGDQLTFDHALLAVEGVTILKARSPTGAPERLSTTVIKQFGEEPLRVLIARAEEVPSLVFNQIEGRAEFSCDPDMSEIIEFDRCFVDGVSIRRGRLYFVPDKRDVSGCSAPKAQAFLVWAKGIFSLARRILTKIDSNCYAGEEAISLRNSGVVQFEM